MNQSTPSAPTSDVVSNRGFDLIREAHRVARRAGAALLVAMLLAPGLAAQVSPALAAGQATAFDDDGDLARKADIMHGARWQRVIGEFGQWLSSQILYTPAEVRRIKMQFNDRVAGMSSYELDYLVDSLDAKLKLLDTPEARDAKAWLGEYLSAMSDSRRAQALRSVPNILDMNSAQLWQEIQRIDAKREGLRQRQQGVEARQRTLADRAVAGRQATGAASRDAAAARRAAPAHSPYRGGGGSPPFSDVPPRRATINVGPFGACVSF
ncbi:MAG: hypothetical protein ACR2IT_11885 [Pirellulales bacterium]